MNYTGLPSSKHLIMLGGLGSGIDFNECGSVKSTAIQKGTVGDVEASRISHNICFSLPHSQNPGAD